MGMADFLKTKTGGADLGAALRVIRELKGLASSHEYAGRPASWEVLEELQNYLEHLTEGSPLTGWAARRLELAARRAAQAGGER